MSKTVFSAYCSLIFLSPLCVFCSSVFFSFLYIQVFFVLSFSFYLFISLSWFFSLCLLSFISLCVCRFFIVISSVCLFVFFFLFVFLYLVFLSNLLFIFYVLSVFCCYFSSFLPFFFPSHFYSVVVGCSSLHVPVCTNRQGACALMWDRVCVSGVKCECHLVVSRASP